MFKRRSSAFLCLAMTLLMAGSFFAFKSNDIRAVALENKDATAITFDNVVNPTATPTPSPIPEMELDTEYIIDYQDQELYFSFTPSESGFYLLSCSENSDLHITVCDSDYNTIRNEHADPNSPLPLYLSKDIEYSLVIESSDTFVTFSFYLTRAPIYRGAGNYQANKYLEFNTTDESIYYIQVIDKTIYNEDFSIIDCSSEEPFVSLQPNSKFLLVTDYDYDEYIDIRGYTPSPIELDNPVSFTSFESPVLLEFKPTKDWAYTVEATANDEILLDVCNIDFNIIEYEYSQNNKISLTYYFEAGKSYYLAINSFDENTKDLNIVISNGDPYIVNLSSCKYSPCGQAVTITPNIISDYSEFTYKWSIDGKVVSSEPTYSYISLFGFSIKLTVSDPSGKTCETEYFCYNYNDTLAYTNNVNRVVAEGSDVTFETYKADANKELNYKWFTFDPETYKATQIEGETSSSLTVTNVDKNMMIYCVVSDNENHTQSIPYTITIDNDFSIKFTEYGYYYTPGGNSPVIEVTPSGKALDGITYKWYYLDDDLGKYVLIPDAPNSNSYQVPTPEIAYREYKCEACDKYGNTMAKTCNVQVLNEVIAVPVNGEIVDIPYNGSVELKVSVTGKDITDLKYQWYRYDYNRVPIEGATSDSFTLTDFTAPDYLICVVTDRFGYNYDVSFSCYVDNGLSISAQDSEINVTPNGSTELKIDITADDYEGLSVRWTDGKGNTIKEDSEVTTSTLNLTNLTTSSNYYCYVSDKYENYRDWAFYVNVTHELTATPEKESYIVQYGGSCTLKAYVTSDDINNVEMTWYDSDLNYIGDGNSVTVNNIKTKTYFYFSAKDAYGNDKNFFVEVCVDNGFSLSFNTSNIYAVEGSEYTFEPEIKIDDKEGLIINWYRNNEWLEGENGETLTISDFTEGDIITCEATDKYNNYCCADVNCVKKESEPTPTVTPVPSVEPTVSVTPTPSAAPTVSPTPTVTSGPSATPTTAVTPTEAVKPTVTAMPTATPVPTNTVTPVPTATPTEEAKVTPTATPTVTPVPTQSAAEKSKADIKNFVDRIYTYVLNREPEEGGEKFWSDELYSFNRSGAEVAQGFIFSQEFIDRNTTDTEFVTILYNTFFGREPDEAGINYWLGQLSSGTMDRVAVANGFIYSKEWADTCAEYGIRSGCDTAPDVQIEPSELTYAFVERMYTTAMGRESDEGGKDYWAKELANFRVTGESVGAMFFLSDEMNGYNLSDSEFVNRLYKTFMDREADEGGLAYWLDVMAKGTSRSDVVYGFTRSPEFSQKCVDARILPY